MDRGPATAATLWASAAELRSMRFPSAVGLGFGGIHKLSVPSNMSSTSPRQLRKAGDELSAIDEFQLRGDEGL